MSRVRVRDSHTRTRSAGFSLVMGSTLVRNELHSKGAFIYVCASLTICLHLSAFIRVVLALVCIRLHSFSSSCTCEMHYQVLKYKLGITDIDHGVRHVT